MTCYVQPRIVAASLSMEGRHLRLNFGQVKRVAIDLEYLTKEQHQSVAPGPPKCYTVANKGPLRFIT